MNETELKQLVFASDKPAEITYKGHKHNPPNADQKRPHPNKRFNKEYRPLNFINYGPSNTTEFFKRN